MRTLNAKLSAALLALLLLFGVVTALLTVRTSRLYMLEVQQKLHRDLAAKVMEDQPLLQDASGREQALADTFEKLMVINPDIEVYLLDGEGLILGYSAPLGRVRRQTVDLGPVRSFLEEQAPLPILGTDPRHPESDNIFSAAALSAEAGGGYLYIVLASEQLGSVAAMVDSSYILQTGIFMVAGSLLLALAGGVALFHGMTGRLRRLVGQINGFEARVLRGNGEPGVGGVAPRSQASGLPLTTGSAATEAEVERAAPPSDELDALERAFRSMSWRISRQLEQLAAQDKARRDLLTNVSHDVRTPLTHLQGYLETMLLKGERLTVNERREYLQIAVQRSEQLGHLIADLLELAKLDAPERALEMESFSVGELVQDVVQRFQLAAREGGVELEFDVDGAPTPVRGNLAAIERAMQNLIENAVRYSESGDRVDVVVRRKGGQVEVAVRDTGPGIPPHELEHVFDRFYRGRSREADTPPGSGLGLSIAHRALELHGTALRCDSRLGEGATFHFALPCTTDPA